MRRGQRRDHEGTTLRVLVLRRRATTGATTATKANTMRTQPPLPLHIVAGFLPALSGARRRRPHIPVATWRTVAAMHAAPGQREVTAARLCSIADDIAPRMRGTA